MATQQASQQTKPNILVIWGDDIGVHNVSAYTHGVMGYRTPNIDRIAQEGALFTDAYGEQSCTTGRAAFILTVDVAGKMTQDTAEEKKAHAKAAMATQ